MFSLFCHVVPACLIVYLFVSHGDGQRVGDRAAGLHFQLPALELPRLPLPRKIGDRFKITPLAPPYFHLHLSSSLWSSFTFLTSETIKTYRTGFWCTNNFRITFLESPGQTLQPWRQALKAERCTRIRRGDRGYRAHVGDRGDSGHGGHYRFEQDESLTKSATHSENAIKSI